MFGKFLSFLIGDTYFLNPEDGTGAEAISFSVNQQRQESLGGSTESDKQPTPTSPHSAELSKEQEPQPVAKMLFGADEQGVVRDVAFQQGGKQITLQDLYPMDLRITVTDFSREEIEKEIREKGGTDKAGASTFLSPDIRFNLEQKDGEDPRLALLHEWGHKVDEDHNYSDYLPKVKEISYAMFKQSIIKQRVADMDNGQETAMAAIREQFASREKDTPAEELAKRQAEFDHFCHLVDSASSINDVVGDFMALQETIVNIGEPLRLKAERHAWANALSAIREMKNHGINVYAGTNRELLDRVDRSLYHYQQQVSPNQTNVLQYYKKTHPPRPAVTFTPIAEEEVA